MTWSMQVRQLIESGFAPMSRECIVCADGSLTVRIYDRDSGRVDLMVIGIAVSRVKSLQDVTSLIDELRDDLATVGSRLEDVPLSSKA